jgi:hypothetical protein
MKVDGTTIAIGIGIAAALLLLGGGTSDQEVDDTVKVAMVKETDPDVLSAFATKLRNAGRYQQADMLDARAAYVTGEMQMQVQKEVEQTVAPTFQPMPEPQPQPQPPPQQAPIFQQQFMRV